MKIAINSTCFLPAIGGVENVMAMLAGHFAGRGHEVRVMTATPAGEGAEPSLGFQILRDPSGRHLWSTVKWCDVFLHANVSLKALHPLLVHRRPWVVSHQGWYHDLSKPITWQATFKKWVARFAWNVACSQSVADYLQTRCEVIPNPYDDQTFRLLPDIKRDRDLLFVGRLVSDKGADLLVDSVGRLRQSGLNPSVTITGSGPEESRLIEQVKRLDLESNVKFTGPLRGATLARCMNEHRILVVPSIWQEPFGIVAVEGIGCGCVVVGSQGGGLKDAIGPCGLTFENGNVSDLTSTLQSLLTSDAMRRSLSAASHQHLSRHTVSAVGDAYLSIFERAITK